MTFIVTVEYLNGSVETAKRDSYKKAVYWLTKEIASKDIVPVKTRIFKVDVN